jgi:hypothetical protein
MTNPREISVSPALIRSIGKNCGRPDLISKTSTGTPSSAWAEFSSMVLSVEHPATMVNGTKDPLQWFNSAYHWAVSAAHRLASKFLLRGLGKSREEKETKILKLVVRMKPYGQYTRKLTLS